MYPRIQDLQDYIWGIYPDVDTFSIQPYSYPITFTNLANGTVQIAQLPMQANADFICLGLSYHARITAGGTVQLVGTKTVAEARLLVTDTGSNQQFTNAAMDLENYASNDAKMRLLPYPRLVQGRSSLSLVLTSYAAADDYDIDLSFDGVLVYTGMMTAPPRQDRMFQRRR